MRRCARSLALLALAFQTSSLLAQVTESKTGPGAAAKGQAAVKVTPEKTIVPKGDAEKQRTSRGRLPAYYGEVVDDAQREKIYQIQASYKDRIDDMKQELKALTDERNREAEAVLTPEQREKVAKLAADAKAKRKAAAAAKQAVAAEEASPVRKAAPAATVGK